MAPSAGNSTAYPKAIIEAKKKSAIPNSAWLIQQLSVKRPKKDDPARAAYDAVVKLAQDAIGGLPRITASQCALMLGISDSAWRHAASKTAPSNLGAIGVRAGSNAAQGPGKKIEGQSGSVLRFTYDTKKVRRFWKKLRSATRKSKAAGSTPAPSPILKPPAVSNAHEVATAKIYFVVVTDEILKSILDEPLTPESLTALLRGGAALRPFTLTQALQMPWRSDELRQAWRQVWDQAIEKTRVAMDLAMTATRRDGITGAIKGASAMLTTRRSP